MLFIYSSSFCTQLICGQKIERLPRSGVYYSFLLDKKEVNKEGQKKNRFTRERSNATCKVRKCACFALHLYERSVKTEPACLSVSSLFVHTRVLARPAANRAQLLGTRHGDGRGAGRVLLLWQHREPRHRDSAGEVWARRQLPPEGQRDGAGRLLPVRQVSCDTQS